MQARRRRPELLLTSDQKRIVWHIHTTGPATRSSLAIDLDMHNASLTKLTRELIMLGCLDELDEHIVGRGRPAIPLKLSGRAGYAAGAMVHPGWIEIVLVDFAGNILAKHSEPFDSPDPRDFVTIVTSTLKNLSSNVEIMRLKFLGIGIAIPGYVATDSTYWTVKWLEGWRSIKYPEYFEDAFGFPVWVENESTLAGLADFFDNSIGGSFSSALSIFVGHGVGGSIIYRHAIISGEHGNTGDIGRLFPDLEKPRPSGIDLVRHINAAGGDLKSLLDVATSLDRHADAITTWMDRAAQQLLTLIESGAAWIDPGAIIVTGSIPVAVLQGIAERIRAADHIFGAPRPNPPIFVTRLGSWAMPIGAAMLPIQHVMTNA